MASARYRPSLSRTASSALLFSVMSRKTMTAPEAAPRSSRTGEAMSPMENIRPERLARTVVSGMVTGRSRARASRTGHASRWPVARSVSWSTSEIGLPRASSRPQPVSSSAARFMKATRASESVAMTPSAMLLKTAASQPLACVSMGSAMS